MRNNYFAAAAFPIRRLREQEIRPYFSILNSHFLRGENMKKILVVDDSPVVRSFHSNILKMSGFKADGACDGIEALEKSLTAAYDLILCDINMPNMDGITFIQRYREMDENAPIIILTTQEDEINKEKGYKAGANLYIVKPVKPSSLILHVQLLLGAEK